MANVMKNNRANVIGMVETDATRTVMGNRDVIEWLAEELHYYSDYGPSTATNVSKYRYIKRTNRTKLMNESIFSISY